MKRITVYYIHGPNGFEYDEIVDQICEGLDSPGRGTDLIKNERDIDFLVENDEMAQPFIDRLRGHGFRVELRDRQ